MSILEFPSAPDELDEIEPCPFEEGYNQLRADVSEIKEMAHHIQAVLEALLLFNAASAVVKAAPAPKRPFFLFR